MTKKITTVIQLRNGAGSAWEKVKDTYIPKAGEACVTTSGNFRGQVKFGDGVSTWGELPYSGAMEIDNESIVVSNGKLAIKGYAEALANQMLKKGEDGLEWFTLTPDTIGAVNQVIETVNGKSYIINTGSQSGAKYVGNNGLESFIGVYDGTRMGDLNGMAAQIYANNKGSGTALNVYRDKISYVSKEDMDAGISAKDEAQEIATIGDVDKVKEDSINNGDNVTLDGGTAPIG